MLRSSNPSEAILACCVGCPCLEPDFPWSSVVHLLLGQDSKKVADLLCKVIKARAKLQCRQSCCLAGAATDGENGERGGDEEEGGDDGSKQEKKSQNHKGQSDNQRGLLKTPTGQGQQMRSRTNGQDSNGYTHTYVQPQHYQTPQYEPQPQHTVDHSPIEYSTYTSPEPMTRHPSINMDWQTLRVPR